jgi:arylsulfatase A-like enzyme
MIMKRDLILHPAPWIFSILLLSLPCCRLTQKATHDFSEKPIMRLLDHLESAHIKSTPFAGILDRFEHTSDLPQENLDLIRELSTARQKVWGVTTHTSILGQSEFEIPQRMRVTLENEPLDFFSGETDAAIQWKWIETNKTIDIRYDENYNKGLKCVVLEVGEPFSFETILPAAPAEIEIYARRNWHPLDLNVYVDDELWVKHPVGRDFAFLRSQKEFSAGSHTFRIQSSISERLSGNRPTPPRLLIYQIKVKTQNDLVLFFVPAELQSNMTGGALEISYMTDLDAQGNKNDYTELYQIQHDFTLSEYEQAVNPESLKKKLVLENLSLNALLAPPLSRYEFEVDIPEKAYLEFGLGIFAYKESQENQAAHFQVLVEHAGEEISLYDKVLTLEPQLLRDQIQQQRIDLSAFTHEKIKLTFLTEQVPAPDSSVTPSTSFAFWANPIITRPNLDKVNVILISLDTLRADHLGCYGYSHPTSPALDKLTKDAVLFANTYAQSSWTLPSHMSILFSLNSASHQVYFNDQKVDESLPSLATFFKDQGYITFGFTGGGYVSSIYGFAKGFDWYDEPVGGRKAPLGMDEAERMFQVTSDWLGQNRDRPFFLFLHTFQIHGPYASPEPWNEMFVEKDAAWNRLALRNFLDSHGDDYPFSPEEKANIIALYDQEIRYTDDVLIGPLIARLKELGIYDNTLLIITSDHGEEFGDHGGWLHGRTVYDELIRVPLIIKFPDSAYKDSRIENMCRLIDIMPTALEASGIKYDKNKLEGRSLFSFLKGNETEDRVFISDLAHKNVPDPCPALIATNSKRLKFIIQKSKEGVKAIEAFDLKRDPRERNNIYKRTQAVRQDILAELDAYYAEKAKLQRNRQRIRMDKELEEKLKALGYLR